MDLLVYATNAEAVARMATGIALPASQHEQVDAMLEGASRTIDDWCRRYFGQNEDEVRLFDGHHATELVLGEDFVSVDEIATDDDLDGTFETVWDDDDFLLEPHNAADRGWPYTTIRVARLSVRTFPIGRRTVRVTGTVGWPAVPAPVKEVCILEAERMFQDSKSPSGVVANEGGGSATLMPPLHPRSRLALKPYRRLALAVACG